MSSKKEFTEVNQEAVEQLLKGVVHPESGEDILRSGLVEKISTEAGKVTITLRFKRSRDPFASKIKHRVEELLKEQLPEQQVVVFIREGEAQAKPQAEKPRTTTEAIAHVVAISSGKGGVGKSTVTANLALTLRDKGFRVGVLDADIYGPSMPKMFGVEGYMPEAERDSEGHDFILPAESMGLKLMSIGFFIRPTDPLMWRGAMAVNALKQMIHQTKWGVLDFLLIDMPPGTGDIHLSIINELKISGAVIVSTPQQVAVADVVRGVEMFSHPQVNIPLAGIIENMAWFSPEELPENRYYLFGRGGARSYAESRKISFLGEVPIIQSVMEGADGGRPAVIGDERVKAYYSTIGEKLVENILKSC